MMWSCPALNVAASHAKQARFHRPLKTSGDSSFMKPYFPVLCSTDSKARIATTTNRLMAAIIATGKACRPISQKVLVRDVFSSTKAVIYRANMVDGRIDRCCCSQDTGKVKQVAAMPRISAGR